jgi:hypothetical protein
VIRREHRKNALAQLASRATGAVNAARIQSISTICQGHGFARIAVFAWLLRPSAELRRRSPCRVAPQSQLAARESNPPRLEPKKCGDLGVGRPQNPLSYRPPPAMEDDMPEPTTSAGDEAPPINEDQAIRERVKGLTSQVLQQGRVDPDAVRDVVRAMIGRTPGDAAVGGDDARQVFADAVKGLDEALVRSAGATHDALQQLASRGKDFTDNDLKEALVSLRKLEEDYITAANRVAEAMSGNLRREMTKLAVHAQNVGVEASARVATMMGEFASGMGANQGLATMRGASVRMALVASGVLAGVADALRDQTEAKKDK